MAEPKLEATEKKTVALTFGYANTEFTRQYKFSGLSSIDADTIKTKVKEVNASITGGTDDGLSDFFRSDDYTGSEGQGVFTGITAAEIDETTTQVIDLSD